MQNQRRITYVKLLFITFILLPIVCLAGVLHITDRQAGEHIGKRAVVEGSVIAVYTSRRGNTFLEFGAPYPNQDFTAVIFAENAGSFSNVYRLKGRRVWVSGILRLYRGKPEIILRSASQLRLIK